MEALTTPRAERYILRSPRHASQDASQRTNLRTQPTIFPVDRVHSLDWRLILFGGQVNERLAYAGRVVLKGWNLGWKDVASRNHHMERPR
jgi:hypothetical protein